MRLLEVEIRHWRGLTATLKGLSPRLNLVLGPNESGKSRIFQALYFGLFESFKGAAQHKQVLQSWTSSESPFVRLVFADGEIEYELQKQFLRGATAQLAGGGATQRGEDAEETLRGMMGVRSAGSRGAGIADRGIWPLLMVSQGDSRRSVHDDLNEDGRGRLQQRLSSEIGIAAISSAGQRLMALAEQEYGRYFTATGQESKTLRDLRTALQIAEQDRNEAAAALQRQEHTAGALAENRLELAELEQRRQRAHQEAEAARARAEAAQLAGNRVDVAQGTVNTAAQQLFNAEESLKRRVEADTAIERLSTELTQAETDLRERASTQRALERALDEAEELVTESDAQVRHARAALDAFQGERRREDLRATKTDLQSRITGLEALDVSIAEARLKRAELPAIDDACLGRLKALDQDARAAAAKLQGAAVTVMIHLRQAATVDGTPRDAGEHIDVNVIENRRISIGDLADIEIRPGGGELDRLRESHFAADAALAEALSGVAATDLDRAAAMHARRTECAQQIVALERQIAEASTKSLGQLKEDSAALDAELARLGPAVAQAQDETALRAALLAADSTLTQGRSARDRANATLAQFREYTAALNATAAATRSEHERLVSLYFDRPTAATLHAAREQAAAERDSSRSALTLALSAFSGLGGSEVQTDARRLAQAAEGLANRLRDLRSQGDRLQGALQTMMAVGHFETKEAAEARVEQAATDLARVQRQAAAAKQLWEVLGEERRRVVERLTAPVTMRVKPYLQELFPGSTLDAGEGLDIAGLQSGNLKEPFTELSGGAQEQISLLARIGLAELLAGDGTLPLILDDALINTDPQRIQRVHRVLFRAADNLQVIVLSCHDVLFDGLGAEFVMKLDKGRYGPRAF